MAALCFVTCANAAEARRIAKALLEKRLAACCNIIPKIESIYRWKGKVGKANESLLIVKTKKKLIKAVVEEIEKSHSYEVPAIEFFETEMNEKAGKWLEEETGE